MVFLGGTFFPVDQLPQWLQAVLALRPITHASRAIRCAALHSTADLPSLVLMPFMFADFFFLATRLLKAARD